MRPHPGRVYEEIPCDLPRPRDRQSAAFDFVKRRVLARSNRSLERAVITDDGETAAAAAADCGGNRPRPTEDISVLLFFRRLSSVRPASRTEGFIYGRHALRAMQAPLKIATRAPQVRLYHLEAKGTLDDANRLQGGDRAGARGRRLASCHRRLRARTLFRGHAARALVACAGVTLKAVATAIDIPLKSGQVSAEGDLDFRGTLGVAKDAPVGFAQIRLRFDVETDAPQDKLDQLLKLTERYCVVYQTLKSGPPIEVKLNHS